ncbi:MAG TPA: type II toxin-antitoxin system Phd/YefM family antitoxin [Candidatus Paceibacterota bacterium]|nr:type II toxin-antitoxin system Phd/YefM family antitoxin [Candidatus Pacearchaeota archaeon]HRZ51235.1 type II toxin-antitoxin system Phd/YefM family antitoxin [Candidatus Paceibacterota bacterium]HSA36957.1 type II toxin-antitoxin system Phd/YefM family antitoxin [Candidatus Paceibacterota bacterium]
MDPKTTISISEARKRIFEIAEEVQKPDNYFTLTEKGRPKAVLMSAEQFDSWQETLEVMREFPKLNKDAKEVNDAVKSGEYKNWTTLEQLLAKEGFVAAEKSVKKYGIPAKNQAKRGKRAK